MIDQQADDVIAEAKAYLAKFPNPHAHASPNALRLLAALVEMVTRQPQEIEAAFEELQDGGGVRLKSGLVASIRMTLRSMNETRKALIERAEKAEHALQAASVSHQQEPPANQACEALEFAQGAILDAIGLEEGLDGQAGARVIQMIRAALVANGRTLTPLPDEFTEADHEPVDVKLDDRAKAHQQEPPVKESAQDFNGSSTIKIATKLTREQADAIEAEMRALEANPETTPEAMRLFMQHLMPCGHAAGNLLTCPTPPYGCVICGDPTGQQEPPKCPSCGRWDAERNRGAWLCQSCGRRWDDPSTAADSRPQEPPVTDLRKLPDPSPQGESADEFLAAAKGQQEPEQGWRERKAEDLGARGQTETIRATGSDAGK